jgi:hypothetical protein
MPPAPGPRAATTGAADPQLAQLGAVLLERITPLAEAMAERIRAEVSFYAGQPAAALAGLRDNCRLNLEFVFGVLGAGSAVDPVQAERDGRRRAAEGVPLPAVMDAYRVGSRFIWDAFVDEAATTGRPDSGTLVQAASEVWMIQDTFTQAMAAGYREAVTARVFAQEQERSALVGALLEGRISDTTTLWETAEILRIPRRGPYVVVAAELPDLGRHAINDVESRLLALDLPSAWRLLPDLQVGIVVLRKKGQLDQLVALLTRHVKHRTGISPQYQALDRTGQALRFARIAMASTTGAGPAGAGSQVTVFDHAPVAVTVASTPEVVAYLAGSVLGPLADLPAGERAVLLDTLQAWRDCGGSAAQAADRLFCHPNTVRHRLRRISAATGRSLTAPADVTELCLALEAARQQSGWPAASGRIPPL